MCMFPACCFCQRIYVAQGHMNGAPNETQSHLCKFVNGMFFRFCMGLYRGHHCMLDLVSLFSLSLYQSVSIGLSLLLISL